MKLSHRIASWFYSPGAFALWCALGNPKEWSVTSDGIQHRQHSDLEFDFNANCGDIGYIIFARWWAEYLGFDTRYKEHRFLGWFERLFLYGRAVRVRNKLVADSHISKRKKNNMNVFTKLTVNEEVK
jgi:hypothetical protein